MNASQVRTIIRREQQLGRTIFLTTHDMTTPEHVRDRVAFVVDGPIVACDGPRQLRLAHGDRRLRVEYRDGNEVKTAANGSPSPRPLDGARQAWGAQPHRGGEPGS